jgi:hypothetical protein
MHNLRGALEQPEWPIEGLVKKRNLNCGENTDRKTNAVSPECEI